MKRMLMHVQGEMLQTAVQENGRLVDFFMEKSKASSLVGNVYKGRVINVLPGMQAAFIDIGLTKNAFLYIDELLHPHLEKQPKHKPPIQELIKPGQELMVQVIKEPLGGKGARVTTHFTLPGRWSVYMPRADYVGVSKKIGKESERGRLRTIGERLRQQEEGIILRTAAEGESEHSLSGDITQARELWQAITARAEEAQAPAELHREAGLMRRAVRDSLTMDMDEIWIDDASRYEEAAELLQEMTPALRERLKCYKQRQGQSLFDYFRVTEQVERAFGRRIPLDIGGHLIWEETEALTVIDVNTGKFTGTSTLEDTVFRANMEAADEIARLLRIRDVGGIIIIDFIDMAQELHREQVMQRMEEMTRGDQTKCAILGWTKLGLLELTRKKARENAVNQLFDRCASCGAAGKGSVVMK
ncbi:Rne/Rng family ribonuclease [Paenibacillus sp. N4]|uniref:Rne/Rng family ribonuclease n=1 Tax=Paenibacillus vietnamensis TaxID=2590547 RepID=UPI001CD06D50|nr:Rne/Rng family ribonuclease [Paenibacillus vietnamensis]MCA0755267.1 Rne/Rng family ribonuclease [Paenibacillus vietnamensis]